MTGTHPASPISAFRSALANLVRANLLALALLDSPLSGRGALALCACHLLGLALLLRLMQLPLVWALAVVAPFALAQFVPRVGRVLSPLVLAPFWFVYAALGLRYIWIRVAHGAVPGYFNYALPDPRVLLQFAPLIAAAVVYALLIFAAFLFRSRARALLAAPAVLGGLTLGWAASEYFGHRTAGATGSDPYAYVQMGVDLAERGTPAHRFALFPQVASSNIAWFPVLHVGYRLPFDLRGDAVTVWSPAGSVAFAAAYRVLGEWGLYLVNPLFTLLAVLAMGLLGWELTRGESVTRRWVVAVLCMVTLATAHEIVNWAGVTMVDSQALVWSALAVYAALRVQTTGKAAWAVTAGVFWGLAYQVRHTQLLVALAFVPLFWLSATSRRGKIGNAFLACAVALLIALPDLWYHQRYLGGWLTPESEELSLFSLAAAPSSLRELANDLGIGAEFGWTAVLVVVGFLLYARRAPARNLALVLWLAGALLIHLPYPALRLRDLLAEFPVPIFYSAFGLVALTAALWVRRSNGAYAGAALLLFLALQANLLRVWQTVPRVVQPPPARFGAMTAAQRGAFDMLARLTPPGALVGSSLNSGAIDLYSRRAAFRPADWSAEEWREFLHRATRAGAALYLLEDNASLEQVRGAMGEQYRLEPIAVLDVPLFGAAPIQHPGALWRVKPESE